MGVSRPWVLWSCWRGCRFRFGDLGSLVWDRWYGTWGSACGCYGAAVRRWCVGRMCGEAAGECNCILSTDPSSLKVLAFMEGRRARREDAGSIEQQEMSRSQFLDNWSSECNVQLFPSPRHFHFVMRFLFEECICLQGGLLRRYRPMAGFSGSPQSCSSLTSASPRLVLGTSVRVSGRLARR